MEKKPIWLLWTLHENGLVTLRMIATSRSHAEERRRDMEFMEHREGSGVVRAWVEKSITNHLFAEGEFERMTYGRAIKSPLS